MSRPPRITGFSYTGPFRYFITCCTHLRQPLFLIDTLATDTLAQFRLTAAEDHFAFLAYCLMPDHLHLLVEGLAGNSDLRRFMRVSKQRAASLHSRTLGGRLWQDGYYDRALRREDDIRATARYVITNPVRAKLVGSATEYKHAGSDYWTIEEILAV